MICLGNFPKQIQINSARDVEFLSKAEDYGIQDAHGSGGHPRLWGRTQRHRVVGVKKGFI